MPHIHGRPSRAPPTRGKGWLGRFEDGRLRKIQSKLGNTKDRQRFGTEYVDGWCRFAAKSLPGIREVRAVQESHEIRDDRGRVSRKAAEYVVLRRSCGPDVKPRTLTVRIDEDDDDDGDEN